LKQKPRNGFLLFCYPLPSLPKPDVGKRFFKPKGVFSCRMQLHFVDVFAFITRFPSSKSI